MSKSSRQRRGIDPAWTPFAPAALVPMDDRVIAKTAEQYKVSPETVRARFTPTGNEEVWKNSRYQVLVIREVEQDPAFPPLIWLSIKRLDRAPIHDWRDLQRIKNELVGPEHEAVELYPAEERLVDSANQYHLWVLADRERRFPFGFVERFVTERTVGKAMQRPFEDAA